MAGTDFTGEVSMLPRVIEVIVRIVRARVMADPLVIGMNVGCLGMSRLVFERRPNIALRNRSGTLDRRRAVCGDVTASHTCMTARRRSFVTTGRRCFMTAGLPAFVTSLLGEYDNRADQ